MVEWFANYGKEGCAINNKLLNELYRTYYREIYLYLYSLSKCTDLAEDLAQDTFLKALLSLSDSHGNVRAWLYMVARNLFFNHYKAEKHISDMESEPVKDFWSDDTLSSVLQQERNRALYIALSRLSHSRREVLIMHYFGGLSQKEIAFVLNLTPTNVRVLTLRAKQELKHYLEVNDHDIS